MGWAAAKEKAAVEVRVAAVMAAVATEAVARVADRGEE